MKENIALFDMDGTLADFEGTMLNDLKKLQLPNESNIENLHGNLPDSIYNRMSLITGSWRCH